MFKPPPTLENYKLKPPVSSIQQKDVMNEILERLSKLDIKEKSSKTEGSKSPIVNVLSKREEETEEEEDLEQVFLEHPETSSAAQVNKINFKRNPIPMAPSRNYYHRPTPVDMGFEENFHFDTARFDAGSIVEWNIDGRTEYQVIDVIRQMLMYATVGRAAGNSESQVASAIVTGFSGQLRGWWDFLPEQTKNEILFATKKVVKDEFGVRTENDIEDGVNTLAYTITLTFSTQELTCFIFMNWKGIQV